MEYMPYVWLGVIVFSVVFEAATVALVSVWFIPAALVSLVLSLFPTIPLWAQVLAFAALSLLLLIFARPVLKKTLRIKNTATNADSVIGESAVVTEPIDNLLSRGQVKVKGQVWTARAYDSSVKYDKDEVLKVVAIEGVKLICKK